MGSKRTPCRKCLLGYWLVCMIFPTKSRFAPPLCLRLWIDACVCALPSRSFRQIDLTPYNIIDLNWCAPGCVCKCLDKMHDLHENSRYYLNSSISLKDIMQFMRRSVAKNKLSCESTITLEKLFTLSLLRRIRPHTQIKWRI